jgi:hypothetical protein
MKRNNFLLLLSIVILSACQNASFLTKKYDVRGRWDNTAKTTKEKNDKPSLRNDITMHEMASIESPDLLIVSKKEWQICSDTDQVDTMEVMVEEVVPMPYPDTLPYYGTKEYVGDTIDAGENALPYDVPKPKKKGLTALLKATSFFFEVGIGILCVLGLIALIAAIAAGSVTGLMLVLAILGIVALGIIGLFAALMALFTVVMLIFLIIFKLVGPGKIGG